MIAVAFWSVYGVCAFLTMKSVARSLYADSYGTPDATDRALCALLGALAGLVWPVALVVLAARYLVFGPEEGK